MIDLNDSFNIKGVYPAMVTPFTVDGVIDYLSIEKVVDFFIQKGVNGLYILGTTGEWPLINKEQRKNILEFVMKQIDDRVPVMVHIGTLPVQDACELANHAENNGVAAISSIPPYYFPFNATDIERYFSSILTAVSEKMPVLLYNIPAFARNVIPIETVKRLKDKYTNFKGIKDSQGNPEMLHEYLNIIGNAGVVLIGSDDLIYQALKSGCSGMISGNANVLPELYITLYSAFQEGKVEVVKKLQTLVNVLAKATNFGRVPLLKAGLEMRGVSAGYAMKPYTQEIPEFECHQLEIAIQTILGELKKRSGATNN
ncbi:MAG: dihydrodipicolinate synthase family protein [Bacillota bacterium]